MKDKFSATVTFDYIEENLEDQIVRLVTDKFMNKLEKRLAQTIDNRLTKLIDQRIATFAEEKMVEMVTNYDEYFPSWGAKEKPTSPLTFQEVVIKRLEKHLKNTVDYQGRDKNPSYNNYDLEVRIDYIMKGCVAEVFRECLNEKMKEIKAEMNEKINEGILNQIKDNVFKSLNIKV